MVFLFLLSQHWNSDIYCFVQTEQLNIKQSPNTCYLFSFQIFCSFSILSHQSNGSTINFRRNIANTKHTVHSFIIPQIICTSSFPFVVSEETMYIFLFKANFSICVFTKIFCHLLWDNMPLLIFVPFCTKFSSILKKKKKANST